MSIVMSLNSYTDAVATTADRAYAVVRYGDNGPANGPDAEVLLGGPSGGVSARKDWTIGTNANGDWEGWGTLRMEAHAGGGSAGVFLDVEGASDDALLYTGDTYGQITDVTLDALSSVAGGSVQFEAIDIAFYNGTTKVDEFTADDGAAAAGSSNGLVQQIQNVSTTNFADSVIITAQVRYTCPTSYYPDPSDLFGKIGIGSLSGGPA